MTDTLAAMRKHRDRRDRHKASMETEQESVNALVVQAFAEGIPAADIIEASGLSKARIYQVAKGTRR